MIRIGIVDDEENARRVISKYLERYCENYEIVFQSEEYQESIDAVLKHKPDLLFLDIHILNGSGIDVASFLKDKSNVKIIFTTAYNEYAIKALKLKAFDYILKPIDVEEFIDSTKRVFEEIKTEKKIETKLAPRKISVTTIAGTQLIDNDKVLIIKAEGSYCEIQLKEGKSITISKPLKFIEIQIEKSDMFIKIHKSYIINIENIQSLDRITNEVLLKDGTKLPISRSNIKNVFARFQPKLK